MSAPADGAALLWLSGADVASLLEPAELVDAMAAVLTRWSEGTATAPPRSGTETGHGRMVAMPGAVAGAGLATKVYTQVPGNAARGLPLHAALVLLFDDETGRPLAAMDGEVITAERTAAASAAATRVLARPGASRLAVVGSGPQAAAHLRYLSTTGDFDDVRVHARRPEAAAALAATCPGARAVDSLDEAGADADVVACCTSAAAPLLEAGSVRPGTHVVSVGTGRELSAALLDAAAVFVEWAGAATEPAPAGLPELAGRDVVELGEVLLGRRPGRRDDDALTVWRSTGLAVEDVATAALVHRRALASGVGTRCAL